MNKRMLGIQGIETKVTLNNEVVPCASNGLITRLSGVVQASLRVELLPGHSFVGYDRAESHGGVTMLRNCGSDTAAYERTVPIFQANGKNLFAPDPKAAIWLLGVDTNGVAHTFIVCLVAQNNYLFLTYWETFAVQCYRGSDGKVVCPGMEDWASMAGAVSDLLGQVEIILPSVSEYKPKPTLEPMPKGQAIVKWYTGRLGVGEALATDFSGRQEVARVHWSQQRSDRKDGLKYFLPGDLIRFERIEPREGHKPFPKWELKEIHLLS